MTLGVYFAEMIVSRLVLSSDVMKNQILGFTSDLRQVLRGRIDISYNAAHISFQTFVGGSSHIMLI